MRHGDSSSSDTPAWVFQPCGLAGGRAVPWLTATSEQRTEQSRVEAQEKQSTLHVHEQNESVQRPSEQGGSVCPIPQSVRHCKRREGGSAVAAGAGSASTKGYQPGMEPPTQSMAQLGLQGEEGRAGRSGPASAPSGGELADPSVATEAAAGPGPGQGPTAAERIAGLGQASNGTATSESTSSPSSSSLSSSVPASVPSASLPALNGHGASSGAMPNDDDAAPSASSSNQPSNAIKAATIQAIKSRDFAASPPPARPAPTALGKSLSAGVPPHAERGLASESAVHTLASSTAPPTGAAGAMAAGRSASAGSALATPMPGAGAPRTGGQPAAAGPTPGAGLRRAGSGAAGLAARIPPSLQAKMAAVSVILVSDAAFAPSCHRRKLTIFALISPTFRWPRWHRVQTTLPRWLSLRIHTLGRRKGYRQHRSCGRRLRLPARQAAAEVPQAGRPTRRSVTE